jgi:hypothetical protein
VHVWRCSGSRGIRVSPLDIGSQRSWTVQTAPVSDGGRGLKCGTIIHESNQLAFDFAGLDEEQFVSRNRNLAVWDAEFDEKETPWESVFTLKPQLNKGYKSPRNQYHQVAVAVVSVALKVVSVAVEVLIFAENGTDDRNSLLLVSVCRFFFMLYGRVDGGLNGAWER